MEKENRKLIPTIAIFASIALVILAFAMQSCSSQKIAGRVTTITKEVVRFDTAIIEKPDTANIIAYLECDSNYNVLLNDYEIALSKKGESSVSMQDGTLNIRTITIHDTIEVSHTDTLYQKDTIETVIERERVRDFFWWLGLSVSILVVVSIVIYVAIKASRFGL